MSEGQQIIVLVVEDDPDAAQYVRTVLERRGGMAVTVAGDGGAAVARLDEQRFDLVVTDIELPGISGLQLIHEARSRDPRVPVIVMTAHANVDYAIEALREAADEFLVKPVPSATLVERATALVEERRRSRPEPARVLAVGAHPDDVEIGVGGILAAHHAAGDLITVLTMSGGGVGGDSDVRRHEAASAAALYGATLHLRDFADTRMDAADGLIPAVEAVVAEVEPTVVYTHSEHDRHQDHRAVHRAVDVAARRVPTVLCYQSPSATIEFRPGRFVPIDSFVEAKVEVLASFASQAHRDYLQPDMVRATARYWSRYGTSDHVEPLEVLRASEAASMPRDPGPENARPTH